MRVEGKSIIVTGAGGSIGEGIALRLAAEGGRVIVNDIIDAAGERVASDEAAFISGVCIEVDGARCV